MCARGQPQATSSSHNLGKPVFRDRAGFLLQKSKQEHIPVIGPRYAFGFSEGVPHDWE
jgi:hypothetical protein